jgi:methyl-accepting chemotaxis protein
MQAVKEKGFPKEISNQNQIPNGQKESSLDFSIGGQKIHDVAVLIGDTGGEAHVGLFTEDVEKAIRNSLIPLLVLLVAIALLGSLSFFLVARTISSPIRLLTQAAEKISLGDIDLPIGVKGGGEIGELAASLERMRFSIKAAMNRLRRN